MNHASSNVIAVLYPGEMGARLGAALMARGYTVVTTLAARGAETARRCRDGRIIARATLAEVVREAQVVLSLVPPAAAEDLARAYAALAGQAPTEAIFVDLNSIRPALAIELAGRIEAAGRSFVDGAINGLASRLESGGTLFLSGGRCGEIAELFGGVMRVKVLGDEVGAASWMKLLLSGISKGVCALVVELAVAAQRKGVLDEMLEASAQIYPEITGLLERMLPTYPRHADRRAQEMRQLEATLRDAGGEAPIVAAVRAFHERLTQVDWRSSDACEVGAIIEFLSTQDEATAGSFKE